MSDRALRNMNRVDALVGNDERPQRQSNFQRPSGKTLARKQNHPASITTGGKKESSANVRPSDVSVDIWNLAEQWIEEGTAALESRPNVSWAAFSQRLSAATNSHHGMRKFVKEFGQENAVSVIAMMINLYWDNITKQRDVVHQFVFLRDQWEDLFDRALAMWAISEMKRKNLPRQTYAPPPPSENNYANIRARQRLNGWQSTAAIDEAPRLEQGNLRERWAAIDSPATIANPPEGTTTDEP